MIHHTFAELAFPFFCVRLLYHDAQIRSQKCSHTALSKENRYYSVQTSELIISRHACSGSLPFSDKLNFNFLRENCSPSYLFSPCCTSCRVRSCPHTVMSRHTVQPHLKRSSRRLTSYMTLPVFHFLNVRKLNLPAIYPSLP